MWVDATRGACFMLVMLFWDWSCFFCVRVSLVKKIYSVDMFLLLVIVLTLLVIRKPLLIDTGDLHY